MINIQNQQNSNYNKTKKYIKILLIMHGNHILQPKRKETNNKMLKYKM